MNRFWALILCMLWLASGYAQSFPYQVSVETGDGHCYADCQLVFTLLDGNGNVVQIDPVTHNAVNTAQYPLYNVQYHYQNLSGGLGVQYDYNNEVMMLTAGTYSVGVRAYVPGPDGGNVLVDTTFNVQLTTTYEYLTASALFNIAWGNINDRERCGYHPSFQCADLGRIQLQITQGTFPYEVTILNEQQDTVRHVLFHQRVNNGYDYLFADYRDYYTIDNLPVGNYSIIVSDSCGYRIPISFTIPDAQPESYNSAAHVQNSVLCTNETVIPFVLEIDYNSQFSDVSYNYAKPYFDSILHYRFINPGNDTTEWRNLDPYSLYGNVSVYDTLPNYCVMFNEVVRMQIRDVCLDTVLDFSYFFKPYFNLFDSSKVVYAWDTATQDTCVVYLQNGITTQSYMFCGDQPYLWELYGYSFSGSTDSIPKTINFRYYRCPLSYDIWSLPDSTLLGHATSDEYTGIGMDQWETFSVDTSVSVHISVTDAQGCTLAEKDTVLVYQTTPMDELHSWFECHNDKDDDGKDHCCNERYLWIQEHGVDANTFRRNMTLRLMDSPLYDWLNFTAVRQDGEWTVTKEHSDNHSTYVEFSYEDGWRATIRDSECFPPGRYVFEVTTDCGVDTITYEWMGYYYDTIAFASDPQYEIEQVCDYVVVTQVSTGIENYLYTIDPSVSNDVPVQEICRVISTCYSPGIDASTDPQGRIVLVFSVPGNYTIETMAYNYTYSRLYGYYIPVGRCDSYHYHYDTITIEFSHLDFDMAAALLCDPSAGTGIVSVRAVNGNAPYTYTVYDQWGATGNVVATNASGFFDNVPLTEGQPLSVLVTDSCNTTFFINLTAAFLTHGSLLWEQGAALGTPHCAGDTIHLTALNFSPPATFRWTAPDGTITTTQTNEAYLPFDGVSGWYKVEVLNSPCGSLIADSMYVPVTQPPQMTFFGPSIACPGSEVPLSFIAQGNGQVSFDVYHSYGHTSLAVNANDTLVHSFPVHSGNLFWVDNISDMYCRSRAPIDSIQVGVYTVSSEVTDFYDTIEDTQLPYNFSGYTFVSTGVYEVAVGDQNGCDSMVALHLTVHYNQLPPPEVSIVTINDTICMGDSLLLQAVIENAEVFANPAVPRIVPGDILCTDSSIVKPSAFAYSGKTALGIVFYVDSTEEHGWAVDLHNLPGEDHYNNYRWTSDTNHYEDIPTLNNYISSLQAIADFDGYGNTLKVRERGNASIYPAAWAVDLDNGWYLPAMGQLVQMYAHFAVVNASLEVVNGTLFPLNERTFYWSSTEESRYRVWNLVYGGSPRHDFKADWLYVRSVRSF